MGARLGMFVLVAFFLAAPVLADTEYVFTVLETGETEVQIVTDEYFEVDFPSDVDIPIISRGNFDGKKIVPEPIAEIKYTTAYLTSKSEGVWKFKINLPAKGDVKLSLPQAVHVVLSEPRALLEKQDAWTLNWEDVNAVEVSYVRVNQGSFPQPSKFKEGLPWRYVIGIMMLLIAGIFLYPKIRCRKNVSGKPNMTEGQMNILRAANPNEAKVLTILMKHQGHIKRNLLEKESELSKSSLASALKNLEHKNIVVIDRTFHVHYISLSDWFSKIG